MFIFPGQQSTSPGSSRCDEKAAPGSRERRAPLRSELRASREGWSELGAVPALSPPRSGIS